jgi:hypothetical protein
MTEVARDLLGWNACLCLSDGSRVPQHARMNMRQTGLLRRRSQPAAKAAGVTDHGIDAAGLATEADLLAEFGGAHRRRAPDGQRAFGRSWRQPRYARHI